jgi:DNA-binding IclR family transcriptional regulator
LKSLLDLGYLDCDRKARTYVPRARISLVGGWVRNRPGGDLETIARALHEATRLTTFIASRNQLYSQYIRVIQGTTPVRFYLEPGGLRLLPASTPGRVLLSQIGEELSTPRLRFSDLKPALDTIRCQGFAYTRDIGTPGLSTMAMPLTAAGQGPALTIAVAGPSALARRRRAPSCAPCAT